MWTEAVLRRRDLWRCPGTALSHTFFSFYFFVWRDCLRPSPVKAAPPTAPPPPHLSSCLHPGLGLYHSGKRNRVRPPALDGFGGTQRLAKDELIRMSRSPGAEKA